MSDTPASVAAEKVAGYFLEWDNIEDAKAVLADRSKALFKAMKDEDFDTKAARVAFREKRTELLASPEDVSKEEQNEAILDLYRSALTSGLKARARPAHARAYAGDETDAHALDMRIREDKALAAEKRGVPTDWDEISRREFPQESSVKVYFIEAPSLGLVKIGSTGMMDRRVAAIQRGVPVPTALIGVIPGGTKREVELHKKYAAHRVHGEWFADTIRPELEILLTEQANIYKTGAAKPITDTQEQPETASQSSGKVSVSVDPSIDRVSPTASQASHGGDDANAGGEDEVSDGKSNTFDKAPNAEQASLAAREGEQAAAPTPHSVAPSSSQDAAEQTSEAVAPPATSLVAPFNNPRCREPDGCHLVHNREACFDCTMAWAARPKDEQIRLWAEANEAARAVA